MKSPKYFPEINTPGMVVIGEDNYNYVITGAMAPQLTSLAIVYSTVYLDADQRKHQSSTSMAFVSGIRWWSKSQ